MAHYKEDEEERYIEEFFSYVNKDVDNWWTLIDEYKTLKIWRREWEPCSTLCMRNEAYFPNIPCNIAFELVKDLRVRKKWDHRLASYNIIHESENVITQRNKLMNYSFLL